MLKQNKNVNSTNSEMCLAKEIKHNNYVVLRAIAKSKMDKYQTFNYFDTRLAEEYTALYRRYELLLNN